jgi:phosphoribosylformylglycinamidine synthase PurS subunit
MTMTDPVADMLTRLRNANSAHHDTVSMPHSKLKSHIAEILQREGYIAGFDVADARVGRLVDVELATDDRGEAQAQLERMCEQLLTNPLIESYEIAFGGGA